ncbi:urease accessory protein UreD [Streptomyces lunaelactis]|uniref:urease accessory protein UreD n=1 Tax=Streptomyces lunaelactis TaxID=1535768 RepID=UPI001584F403|nr:urease accessory protein UreD [Streptomyces lunaelactis]NUL01948.1 urease accessory protein UreD [Streptomyces lunaelactis]
MTRTTDSAPLPGPGREATGPVQRAAPGRLRPTGTEHHDAGHDSPRSAGAGASEESVPHPSGVHATARIRAEHNGRTTTLPLLHSDGPFHLRRLRCHDERARVNVLGAMSAPLGGDRLALDITADTRARLDVTTSAATIALRGSTTDPATYDVRLTAGKDASLIWLPQPLISTRGSTLHQTYTVELASTARLVLREEQLLGRTAEPPGHLTTRLTVRRAGRLLLDQHTAYGGPAPAWDGPAVLGNHRACGQLLVVRPDMTVLRELVYLGDDPEAGSAVLAPLADSSALLATAVASTPARLRDLLDTALAHAEGTASPAAPRIWSPR